MFIIDKTTKKTDRSPNPNLFNSLPLNIKSLQQTIISSIQSHNPDKLLQFFQYYNIKCLQQIWKSTDDHTKIQMLKNIGIRVCQPNQIICSFKYKKVIKEILINLEGSFQYKFGVKTGKSVKVGYYCRPGQIVSQPINNKIYAENQFKPFSLIATTKCIFLRIQYNSILRETIDKNMEINRLNLLNNLSNYSQAQNNLTSSSIGHLLMPYFSSCHFKKNQSIFTDKCKIDYVCYIAQGEIQIFNQVREDKCLSVVTISANQFYNYTSTLSNGKQNQSLHVKCASLSCFIYFIPTFIINQLSSAEFRESMSRSSSLSQSLHTKILKKNRKIEIDPLLFLKTRKGKIRNKKKKSFAVSTEEEQPWDLINHVAGQMKRKFNISSASEMRRNSAPHSKSAHVTRRQFAEDYLQKIKLKKAEFDDKQFQQTQQMSTNYSNAFRSTLKIPLKTTSSIFSNFRRTVGKHPIIQSKNNLVKKTKYKLIRYAKGHNLYELNDYF